jgi:hypothetical protein
MPKAIALIAGSSLGPEAIDAVRKAFDNAWAGGCWAVQRRRPKRDGTTNSGHRDFVRRHE